MGNGPYEHYKYPLEQCKRGGKHRAKSAKRDKLGRFMPNNPTKALPAPANHGKAGGKARARYAKRDSKGRFTK